MREYLEVFCLISLHPNVGDVYMMHIQMSQLKIALEMS